MNELQRNCSINFFLSSDVVQGTEKHCPIGMLQYNKYKQVPFTTKVPHE